MLNQSPRFPVQGTGAEQNLHALKNGIFTLFLLLSTTLAGWAQSPDTLALSSLPYSLEYPTTPLSAGDTLEIAFHLGTAQEPISHAVGFQLEFQLSNKLVQEVCEPFSSENSWLLDDPEGTGGQHTDSSFMDPLGTSVLHLQSISTDTLSRSGHGELLRFKVVANEDIDDLDDLVIPGGGLVLVDNVEMKDGIRLVDCPEWKLAPNPANDMVRVEASRTAQVTAELLNLRGEVIEAVSQVGNEMALEAISGLPEGLYLVRMRDDKGCREVKRLVVKH